MALRVLEHTTIQEKGRTALVWGPSGIGKTTLASELPKCLYIDVELRSGPWTDRVYANGGMVAHLDSLTDMETVYKGLTAADGGVEAFGFAPESVVIDSLSDFTDLNISELENSKMILNNRGEKDQFKLFRLNLDQFKHMVRHMKARNVTFIATALEKEAKSGTGLVPNLPGQLAERLPASFDISARYAPHEQAANDTRRRLFLSSTNRFAAKAPAGVPPIIDVASTKEPLNPERVQQVLQEMGLVTTANVTQAA